MQQMGSTMTIPSNGHGNGRSKPPLIDARFPTVELAEIFERRNRRGQISTAAESVSGASFSPRGIMLS
jgi:hypothetical protein